jgi:hypothetical protein
MGRSFTLQEAAGNKSRKKINFLIMCISLNSYPQIQEYVSAWSEIIAPIEMFTVGFVKYIFNAST